MKSFNKHYIVLIIIQFLACTTNSNRKQDIAASQIETLKASLDKFNTAFRNGNTEVIESMITEDYIHTNGNSKAIDKNTWISYLHNREMDIQSGRLKIINYDLEDLAIRYSENLAIVTGKVSVSSQRQDKIEQNEYRVTNIWILEDGNWKRAGFHDGKIK